MTTPISGAVLLGRILLATIFILSGLNKVMDFSGTAEHMAAEGIPASSVFLVGAIVLELVGGLMVLFGFKGRAGAVMLIVFLIPATLIFHDFWAYEGQERQMQMVNFMKNLSILGGLTFLLGMGPGPASIDHRAPAH